MIKPHSSSAMMRMQGTKWRKSSHRMLFSTNEIYAPMETAEIMRFPNKWTYKSQFQLENILSLLTKDVSSMNYICDLHLNSSINKPFKPTINQSILLFILSLSPSSGYSISHVLSFIKRVVLRKKNHSVR
jgi:hypothetical protein